MPKHAPADAEAKGPDRLDATDRCRLGEFEHRQDARSRIERGRQPLASSTRRRPSDLLGRPNLQEQERKDKALLLSFPTSFIGNPAVLLVPPAATITACESPKNCGNDRRGKRAGQKGNGQARKGAGRPVRPEDDGPTTRTKKQGPLAVIPDIVYRESSSLPFPPSATITAGGFPLKTAGMTEGEAGRPERMADKPERGGSSLVPRHRALIGSPDASLPPARVAPKLVRLHSILRRRDIGTLHVSPASRPRTRDGFTLQGFDKRLRSRRRCPLSRGSTVPTPTPYIL